MLDTRLGAAFTLSLPFVLGIISVQTFGANNLLVGDGLVPAKTLQPPLNTSDPTLFNKIHIAVDTYALQPNIDCEQAVSWKDAELVADMKCVEQGVDSKEEDSAANAGDLTAGTMCKLRFSCGMGGGLAGNARLVLSFRDSFQRIKYTVRADSWNGLEPDNVVGGRFGQTGNAALSGTEKDPTMLNFELTRSRFRDITGTTLWGGADLNKPYRFGLQLVELPRRLEESGPLSGRHYVAFSFASSANIFSRQHSDHVEATAQVSTLFTLLLSVLAFFRFAKTQVENLIDNVIMYLAEKKKFPVPKDVQRRVRVLEERPVDDPGAGRGVGSRGVPHASQRRPSRRLSRLLSHDAGFAAATGGEIEMVSVSNPMARGAELPEEGGGGLSKTRTNATVKQLQAEMGLLNVKLAQQQGEVAQQREEASRQREEVSRQREEAARQREEAAQLREELARQREEAARQREEAAQQNVKLAQQQSDVAQQREEAARQREELARQRQEMSRQRQEMSRLMAIVESTVVSSSVGAAEDGISSLPEGWKALKTEDGKTYYEKPDHSTTWDLP
jgi:hypothetical protein